MGSVDSIISTMGAFITVILAVILVFSIVLEGLKFAKGEGNAFGIVAKVVVLMMVMGLAYFLVNNKDILDTNTSNKIVEEEVTETTKSLEESWEYAVKNEYTFLYKDKKQNPAYIDYERYTVEFDDANHTVYLSDK